MIGADSGRVGACHRRGQTSRSNYGDESLKPSDHERRRHGLRIRTCCRTYRRNPVDARVRGPERAPDTGWDQAAVTGWPNITLNFPWRTSRR